MQHPPIVGIISNMIYIWLLRNDIVFKDGKFCHDSIFDLISVRLRGVSSFPYKRLQNFKKETLHNYLNIEHINMDIKISMIIQHFIVNT
jgi:hypothetical protein